MKQFTVLCERCGEMKNLSYNGEHYLVPPRWVTFWDENAAGLLDKHLCPDCFKKAIEPIPQPLEFGHDRKENQ